MRLYFENIYLFYKKHARFFHVFLVGLVLAYFALKAYTTGVDFNVYLYAATQLRKGENIYGPNPFNLYLYSPLFALFIKPLTYLNWNIARFLWLCFNGILIYRLFQILYEFSQEIFEINPRIKWFWSIAVILVSIGFLNRNIQLGQVTILILWLSIEGLTQIFKQKKWMGILLITIGINFKIIPLLLLWYLFFKKEFGVIFKILVGSFIALILPSLFLGWDYNLVLLNNWKTAISPTSTYVFETDMCCHSLSCILPIFFSAVGKVDVFYHFKRVLLELSYGQLWFILQTLRGLLLLLIPLLVFLHKKNESLKKFYFLREMGALFSISILFFPHQMNYSLIYFMPAVAYILLYYLKLFYENRLTNFDKIIAVFSCFILLLIAIDGRDVIGDFGIDFLAFYQFFGWSNIYFLILLFFCNPTNLKPKEKIRPL